MQRPPQRHAEKPDQYLLQDCDYSSKPGLRQNEVEKMNTEHKQQREQLNKCLEAAHVQLSRQLLAHNKVLHTADVSSVPANRQCVFHIYQDELPVTTKNLEQHLDVLTDQMCTKLDVKVTNDNIDSLDNAHGMITESKSLMKNMSVFTDKDTSVASASRGHECIQSGANNTSASLMKIQCSSRKSVPCHGTLKCKLAKRCHQKHQQACVVFPYVCLSGLSLQRGPM